MVGFALACSVRVRREEKHKHQGRGKKNTEEGPVHFVFVRFVVGRKKNGVLFVRNDRIRVVVICFGFRFTIKLGRGQKWDGRTSDEWGGRHD